MQKVLILCLVLVALTGAQQAKRKDWWNTGKSVILKSNTFNDYVGKDKHAIVQFYGSHPSYAIESQKLIPEWDKLADMYTGNPDHRSDINVAKIDGWTFPAISQKYHLKAFPAILFFIKGSSEPKERYTSQEKTAQKLSEWIEGLIAAQEKEDQEKAEKEKAAQEAAAAPAAAAENNAATGAADAKPADTPATDNTATKTATPEPAADNAQNTATDTATATDDTPVKVVVVDDTPQQAEQTQKAAADNAAKAQPKVEAAQPKVEVAQPKVEPAQPKEVKVVLDTNLLKGQFTTLQGQLETVNQNIHGNIAENFKKVEDIKELINSHKQELTNLNNYLKSHSTKLDELSSGLTAHKQEVPRTVTSHTDKQFEELKTSLNQLKTKLSEKKEEPKGTNFGQGALFFIVGSLVGAGVAYVILNQSSRNKRKILYD